MMKQPLNIEIKKIILTELQSSGYSIDHVITELITRLHSDFKPETFSSTLYKEISEYILAYLSLGFSYLDHQELFDRFLSNAGYTEQQLHNYRSCNKSIPLKKAKIRALMGRWPASPHNSHTITEAIDEIIAKIEKQTYGTYIYYTAKKDGTYTALYKLIITPESSLFQDVFQNRFYHLVKE